MPRLVFDVRTNHDTGVSRYGLSVLATTAPLLAEAGWRLVVVTRPVQEQLAHAAVDGLGTGRARVVVDPTDEGFVRHSPWLRDLLAGSGADLYYTSHYTVDRACPVPFVFTIHDLTRLRFPQWSYTDASFAERFGDAELDLVRAELNALSAWTQPPVDQQTFTRYFWALNRHLVTRAQSVVTVSRATAQDVITFLGADPGRVCVAPCGVDNEVFFRRDEAAVRAVRREHGLTGPYLMFVGLTHPNKRFPWLVEQLLRARHLFPAHAKLVVVGGHAETSRDVTSALARYDATDLVAFTGRIPDAELAALYSGASALVTASVNEGNSLPPQEALACGAQAIATDIPPLRETLGQAASFYEVNNGDQLAFLARQALTGQLSDRTWLFRPPTWLDAGRSLFGALTEAVVQDDQAERIRA